MEYTFHTIVLISLDKNRMSTPLRPGFTFGGWLPDILPEIAYPNLNIFDATSNPDNYWQLQALRIAMKNAAISSPNPAVGCIVVNNTSMLAEGTTEEWGSRHAERVAFAHLQGQNLTSATVFVTLEPCATYGRQPPCVDLFQSQPVKKIVVGMIDPNPANANKGIPQLKNLGISVEIGCLATENRAWLYPFYIQQTKQRPCVILKWAQSHDGCLAADDGKSKWISNALSRKYTHWLRNKYDVILVGAGTVLTDFPMLTVRNSPNTYPIRHPLKVIYDPSGRLLTCSENIQTELSNSTLLADTKKVLLISENVLSNIKTNLNPWAEQIFHDPNTLILHLPNANTQPAHNILTCLSSTEFSKFLGRPAQSIFVEGGARLLSFFLEEKCFDLIHRFRSPTLLHGTKYKLPEIDALPLQTAVNMQLGTDELQELVWK